MPELVLQEVRQQDIYVATETWLGEGRAVPELEGFEAFGCPRPRAYNTRGGIACYVRHGLFSHVAVWRSCPYGCYIVLKLTSTPDAAPLFVVACYVPPVQANAFMHDIADVWERLGDEVSEAKGLGSVLLVGDLNAHTAGLPDFPAADAAAPDAAQGAEGAATCSVRRSEDAARPANSHGRQLLALCQQSGLRILNGRVCGDSAGALTYLGHNGSGSLVDYALACPVSFHMVQSMLVVPQVDSDHSALHLTVALPQLERRAAAPQGPAPPARRRVLPEKAESWAESLESPHNAAQLASIAETAASAAAAGPAAMAAKCAEFEAFIEASLVEHGAIAESRSGPVDRAVPRWWDAELATARRAARRAVRRDPRSADAVASRRAYRRLVQRKRRSARDAAATTLVGLARTEPKVFWQKFKTPTQKTKLTADQLHTHFEQLLGQQPPQLEPPPPQPRTTPAANGAELNTPFTAQDVAEGISLLRGGKSCLGLLSVAALRAAAVHLGGCLAALFNGCVEVNTLPEAWSTCAVTPIHKGGATTDPGNYRGIAVGSLLGKLFAIMLNSRLTDWLERHNLRARGQAGFRRDHRTADHMLLLQTLVEQQRAAGEPLYVCFVDYQKAYDSVPRHLLWEKLSRVGVSGWFMQALQSLYAEVRMQVRVNGELTEPIFSMVGLKQGCPASPTLFGVYVDDFEDFLMHDAAALDLPLLAGQPVPPCFFADDQALMSTSASGLQLQLDRCKTYSDAWGLQVHPGKTKWVVFHRVGQQPPPATFYYEGQVVEQVPSFKYLGVPQFSHEAAGKAGNIRMEAADRTLNGMLCRCGQLGIQNPALMLNLFNALVLPGLMYGVEMWGVAALAKGGDMAGDKVLRRCLRRVLGVSAGTPNEALLAEAGRYPMALYSAAVLARFWNRLVLMPAERLVKQAFLVNVQMAAAAGPTPNNFSCWATQVVSFFSKLGLQNRDAPPQVVDVDALEAAMRRRFLDSMSATSKVKLQHYLINIGGLDLDNYGPAAYLQAVPKRAHRRSLAQLRTGCHWLRLETGRRGSQAVPRHLRTCERCQCGEVDDEQHMVFRCEAMAPVRQQFAGLFATQHTGLASFLSQESRQVAAFVEACEKACRAFD